MALMWNSDDIVRAEDLVHERIGRDAVVYSARAVAPGLVVLTGTADGSFMSWLVRVQEASGVQTFRDSEEAVRAARRSWNAGGASMMN